VIAVSFQTASGRQGTAQASSVAATLISASP
jgi:hypothetical protein